MEGAAGVGVEEVVAEEVAQTELQPQATITMMLHLLQPVAPRVQIQAAVVAADPLIRSTISHLVPLVVVRCLRHYQRLGLGRNPLA